MRGEARPDDLRRALEYLPEDWRFGEVERARFADYLRTRLTAKTIRRTPTRLW